MYIDPNTGEIVNDVKQGNPGNNPMIGGMVDIANVLNGNQNRQKVVAQQLLENYGKAQQRPEMTQSFEGNDAGAAAMQTLGMDPGMVGNAVNQSDVYKYHQALQQIPQDEITPGAIEYAQLQNNQPIDMAGMRQQGAAENKANAAAALAQTKADAAQKSQDAKAAIAAATEAGKMDRSQSLDTQRAAKTANLNAITDKITSLAPAEKANLIAGAGYKDAGAAYLRMKTAAGVNGGGAAASPHAARDIKAMTDAMMSMEKQASDPMTDPTRKAALKVLIAEQGTLISGAQKSAVAPAAPMAATCRGTLRRLGRLRSRLASEGMIPIPAPSLRKLCRVLIQGPMAS